MLTKILGVVVEALALVSLVERLRWLAATALAAVQRCGRPRYHALLWWKESN
jgi:hypothetical protein